MSKDEGDKVHKINTRTYELSANISSFHTHVRPPAQPDEYCLQWPLAFVYRRCPKEESADAS